MKSKEHLNEEACWSLLRRFPHGNLCGTTPSGTPVLRTLNHSLLDGAIYFHGAARGEKRQTIGRPAVFGCEEVVAQIPSYWRDPVLACPATTWYQSAQAHGMLEVVEDHELKARAMSVLMKRLQPEGGHLPIEASSIPYKKMLNATAVFRLVPTHLTGRSKLGHSKKPEDIAAILQGLWRRGTSQDLRGIETILAGNQRARRPQTLCGPAGVELLVHPTDDLAIEAANLLQGEYWNLGRGLDSIAEAQTSASAWIGARDPKTRRLVGTAAAISNHSKQAYIFDIVLEPAHRGTGLGKAIVSALLDHPRVRRTGAISLRTRDAQGFYNQFGFKEGSEIENPLGATTMLRVQSPAS
jgi:GNAT superfamily N-acetyltransferase/nitroimidazol reductase NimA-like FMN-containing flavoprotein (pyridoxamine 5'-phosphate oxidase superfamily)